MRKVWALLVSATLAGCNLAPRFERPAPQVYSAYPSPPAGGRPAAELGWEQFFGDPRLRVYVAAALANNRDLAQSVARIRQARAQVRVANADRLPNIDATASGTRTRTPLSGLPFPTGAAGGGDTAGGGSTTTAFTQTQYQAQVAVTSFELDFWGRVYNASEAARRRYLGTVEAARAFRLSLISDVAASYYTIRAGEAGVALAERTVLARRDGVDIARLRLDAGVTSTVDFDQAVLLLTQAQSDLADLQRTTEQQRNQLLVLIGGPITAPLPESRPLEDAGQFERIDAGLPSALLQNRPDIVQTEQELRATNADIGAARAAFFPTISLTGAFGFVSSSLGGLFDGANRNWSYGAQAALPLLDWGRRSGNLEFAKGQRDEAVAAYQKAIQTAFREVSDALVARQRLREQIEVQERSVVAQQRLADTARLRYSNGISIYLQVLDAERNLFAAQQQLLQLRSTQLQNGVSLYVALGGGLQPVVPETIVPATPIAAISPTAGVLRTIVCSDTRRYTIAFDDQLDQATLYENGKVLARLPSNRPASGFWYSGSGFELRGKGSDLTLSVPRLSKTSCKSN